MSRRPPTQRYALARKSVLAGAACVLLLGLASFDWRQARPQREPTPLGAAMRVGDLLAGAGKAEVILPADVPLAGYRPFGRGATEEGAPIHVRALLLEVDGLRTGIVAVELMTLPSSLAARLREQLGEQGAGCALLAATHSHSGPGGYDRDLVPQAVAVGRFDERVEAALLEAAAQAIAAARADLGPATIAAGEGRLAANFNRDRAGSPTDDRLLALELRSLDGPPIARLLRYAAHPTLNPRGVGPSGDWPGAAMAYLEEEGGVGIVLQGAVGDARAKLPDASEASEPTSAPDSPDSPDSPDAPGRSERPRSTDAPGTSRAAGPAATFGALIAREGGALPLARGPGPTTLGCSESELALPQADLGAMVPWPLGPSVSNLASLAAPETAKAVALRLDDLLLLGVPAEPTFAAARLMEEPLEANGLSARIVSLAQGYVGYAPLPKDVDARVFSARYSWFGGALASRLGAGAGAAAEPLLPRLVERPTLPERSDDLDRPDGFRGQPGP